MHIKTQHPSAGVVVVSPVGRIDVESSASVRQALMDIVETEVQLILIDLHQVEFMDSSGLSALVSGMKALRSKGGALSICCPNAQVRTALRLTMLDRVFSVYESQEAALKAPGTSE
jgi:anti-sigma B factor antagonist